MLNASIEAGVERFVYTSTIDVVIGYEEIHDGDEGLPVPASFLFPGYPETKFEAETMVLNAHSTPSGNGKSKRF